MVGQAVGCASVYAQAVPPDGGTLLKELQRLEPAPKPPAAKQELGVPQERAAPADGGARIRVRGFRITGATLISTDELNREISGAVGSELTLADLRKAALRLGELYQKKGFFARALLPEQRFADGVVEIAVIESKLGAIEVETLPGTRLSAERARQTILSQQPLDAPLNLDAVRWGMGNLNDLPGVAATGVLQSGAAHGDVNLAVRVESMPLLTAGVYADNHGIKSTGQIRAIGYGQLNSPLGYGDRLSLLGVATARSDYERAGYTFPVGYTGLQAGLSAARLGYRLGGVFSGFSGSASLFDASLSRPLRRTPTSNLYGGLALAYKHLVNDAAGDINLSNKNLKTAALQIHGDFADSVYGGASNAFSATVLSGKLDLGRNTGNLIADEAGAQTQGSFTLLRWSVHRIQQLAPGWDISLTAGGQFAANNLDSSEKFSLGGPTGVRAYPSGEALGDDGRMVSLELRRTFNAEFQATTFVDAGHVKLLHSTFPGYNTGNPNKPNSYSLYGMGMGLQYGRPGNFVIKGSVARKLGTNPGRDANEKDSDGGSARVRGWIQLAKFF
jgi:hemolysin activation/secretion protein